VTLESAKGKITYLFESPDFDLYKGKIQIRMRTKKGKATLTVKNFEVSEAVVNDLQSKGASCEYDVHAGLKTGSCKFNQALSATDVSALLSGQADLSSLISDEQKMLMDDLGPVSGSLSQVRPLGPVQDLSADADIEGLPAALSLDVSVTPKGTEFMEIKTVATDANWEAQRQATQQWLTEQSVNLCPDQSGVRLRKFQDLMGN
jgi:hypothetical protein